MSKNYLPISILDNNNNSAVNTEVYDEVILEGLQKPKDRIFLLKLEKTFIEFVQNINAQQLVFKDLNSYHRLFVHRLAVNYKLSHPTDHGSKTVILYKNIESEVPKLKFCDIKGPSVTENESPLTKGMMIMKRNSETKNTFKPKLATKQTSVEDKKSALSLEEREAAYRLARARIFSNANASGTDSSPNLDNFNTERDTDSEASLQFKDDSMEDKDGYQRGRVAGFSQVKDETRPSQFIPLNRISYRSVNASNQPEPQPVNYFDNDYPSQSYDNRQQYQADQSSSINSQYYNPNSYMNRRTEGQSTKSIAETAAPYQQFQIQFQPGYNAPPINNSYQLESTRNYPTTQQYGVYNSSSSDQYYNPYGNNSYMGSNSAQTQYQFNPVGPTDISFRPPPVNRQLFDHTKPSTSKSNQSPNNNSSNPDINKLTQSLNSIRLNNDQTPTYQYRSPRQLQYTLQVLPKSGSEPLRNVFIKGAMIKRVQQRSGNYVLLALFDSEETADLAIQTEANNPNSQFYLIKWEGENLTPGAYNGPAGQSTQGILNNNKSNNNNNQSRVQAI